MRYIFDNDLHIHSNLSLCSTDANQTPENILKYAKENNLKTICLTDHFWDSDAGEAINWYSIQDYKHISAAKPLPQEDGVEFLFGCETEFDKDFRLGLNPLNFDKFDFIVIPTTHLHFRGFVVPDEDLSNERKAQLWVERLDALLNMPLPFHKIGIAHLTTRCIEHINHENLLKILNLIKDEDIERLMKKAAKLGCGIEINCSDMGFDMSEADTILRFYKIAKKCGCKFYCGSDAHGTYVFKKAKEIFERAIDLLGLTEDDKFIIKK